VLAAAFVRDHKNHDKHESGQMGDADYRNITQWLVAQIRAGHSAHALLQSMCERGWGRDVAMGLIAQAMGERVGATALGATALGTADPIALTLAPLGQSSSPFAGQFAGQAAQTPAAQTTATQAAAGQPTTEQRAGQSSSASTRAMPAPALDDEQLYLDAGDRKVSVLMRLPEPQIVLFGDFLSKNECDRLVDAARPRMQRSLTADRHTGIDQVDTVRTSRGMFFQRDENPLVRTIEARIARLFAWPVDRGEHLQVLHYRPGDRYEPHYDYFDPAGEGAPALLARGGQRIATLLMYLREPERGGETTFPDLGLRFAAKRGCALFFSYDRPHPSTKTLHGGAPVIAGEKWVATKWLREGVFV
jgi:prolyl 4-hydroxylase